MGFRFGVNGALLLSSDQSHGFQIFLESLVAEQLLNQRPSYHYKNIL